MENEAKHKPSERVNIEKLKKPATRQCHAPELNDKLRQSSISNMSPNEAWKTTSEICKETAKGAFGTKEANQKPSSSNDVQELSSKQKKLRDGAESNQNKQQRKQLEKERNKVLKKPRNQLKFEKTAKQDEELKEIEAYKNDSSKYYQAMRKVISKKPKKSTQNL